MKSTVPQFIERESPIVGPLTFKQFAYIGGACIVCVALYFFIGNFFFFILVAILVLGVGAIMAFLKVEGLPAPTILINLLKFQTSPKMYIWKKEQKHSLENQIEIKSGYKSRLKNLQNRIESR